MDTPVIDTALRLILMKTDFAARVAVVRAERAMQAELLDAVRRPAPPAPGTGTRLDRSA